MCRYRSTIKGSGDYIIGMYRIDFYNVCIRDTRVPADHQMILVELKGCVERRKRVYRRGWGGGFFPIAELNRVPMCEEYATFDELKKEEINKFKQHGRGRHGFQRQPGGWWIKVNPRGRHNRWTNKNYVW